MSLSSFSAMGKEFKSKIFERLQEQYENKGYYVTLQNYHTYLISLYVLEGTKAYLLSILNEKYIHNNISTYILQ